MPPKVVRRPAAVAGKARARPKGVAKAKVRFRPPGRGGALRRPAAPPSEIWTKTNSKKCGRLGERNGWIWARWRSLEATGRSGEGGRVSTRHQDREGRGLPLLGTEGHNLRAGAEVGKRAEGEDVACTPLLKGVRRGDLRGWSPARPQVPSCQSWRRGRLDEEPGGHPQGGKVE